MLRSILTFAAACAIAAGATIALFPSVASATCGRDDCASPATRQISAITVEHFDTTGPSDVPVEPDTGETIDVTAYWDTLTSIPGCNCYQTATATVTVDIDWNETTDSWDATCTGCSALGPIYGVTVCHGDGCGTHTTIDNAWEYELVVDIAKMNGLCNDFYNGYLSKVEYETTSVDDGDTIRTANCTELASVSPTSQTFSATDSGPFECVNTCAAASGPTMTLTYE